MAGTDVLDGLLDDFVAWLNATYDPATEPDIDADVVDALLTTRRDYAGVPDAEQWHPGDLTELLLEVAPRQVTFHQETIDRTAPSLAAYLRFLDAEHRLQPAGVLPARLAELAAVSGEYPEAMRDTARFGPAKQLTVVMAGEGVDLCDGAAVQEWITAFNDRPLDQRPRLNVGPGAAAASYDPEPVRERIVLRPVSLAPQAELRSAAARSPMLTRVGGLLDFLGQGRPVTATGNLRVADGKALVDLLGTGDVVERIINGRNYPTCSSADLRGVDAVWQLAVQAGLVALSATRAYPVGSVGWLRAEPLEVLTRLADAAMELGVGLGREPRYGEWWADEVDAFLPLALIALYQRGEPVPVEAMVSVMVDDAEPVPGFPGVVDALGALGTWGMSMAAGWLQRSLARLEDLGMVERLGVTCDPRLRSLGIDHHRATSVALTPLGFWWLQRSLPANGLAQAPLLYDLAGASAGELLGACLEFDVDGSTQAVAAWLARRDPAAAAAEVLVAMRNGVLEERQFGMVVLDQIGPGAERSVREALEEPGIRPYARKWLAAHGLDSAPAPTDPDALAFFVDAAATLLLLVGPERVAEKFADVGDAAQQEDLLSRLWRVESAHTAAVLEAVGEHHGDKRLRKAARKSLFRLRSASGCRPRQGAERA